jgi:hypothetical protein
MFRPFSWVCGTEPLNSLMPLKELLFSAISVSVVRSSGHQGSATVRMACAGPAPSPAGRHSAPGVQRIDSASRWSGLTCTIKLASGRPSKSMILGKRHSNEGSQTGSCSEITGERYPAAKLDMTVLSSSVITDVPYCHRPRRRTRHGLPLPQRVPRPGLQVQCAGEPPAR